MLFILSLHTKDLNFGAKPTRQTLLVSYVHTYVCMYVYTYISMYIHITPVAN